MTPTNLKLTTCLWFDGQASDAAHFYTSIFPNSQILTTQRFLEAGKEHHGREPGSVMVVEFDLDGHRFVGLNGGPQFKHSEAVSFQIDCATQDEVDYYWARLGKDAGGDETKGCGWVADKFGVCWQVIPTRLKEMIGSEDKEAAGRAAVAMGNMTKFDIEALEKAFRGD
ncbi:3-demethylubiquinone-9 3-O-methyltransferase [Canariomyces notabilis]|uniref:3-demethylubiquinone-9 3-O-methyltransferase n=1 Tax=Canariomyces notabilis TaxID=2074819 RepID=A0AAN6T9G6_9PEZI|nr:3-demethylubiquinone-9 3-O-methyltransferase [Canariomyces arenarius]